MRYDHDTQAYKVDTVRPSESKRDGWLTAIIVALVVMAFIAGRAAAADHPLCQYFAALANEPGVEVAQWIGYPKGWQDYPEAWEYETFTDLANGSGILTRSSEGKRWLWAFRSLTEDNGNHDFCEHVLIISENP